ncbi:hypothetical protein KIN20_035358 [Parelaphostrongylus tenuis]|uniref:Uncharacterized protein n=1 Tax=Parelaphostrongylus tenuis TaxID=148309 RepID=A0AAD5RB29_PARTN|nr:hypothetical protein KIN20_035358 [Parelaphostrongylus tenuis]
MNLKSTGDTYPLLSVYCHNQKSAFDGDEICNSPSCVTTTNFNPKEQDVVLVGFFVEESPPEDILNRTLLVEYFMENDRPPRRFG